MKLSRGVIYMFIAIAVFACMNLFVKLLVGIPPVQVVFFRSVVSLLMSLAMLKAQKVPFWGKNKKVLIMRGLVGAIALVAYFATIQNLPLATAVTLQFLSPIFTAILGIFIVKERVHPIQFVFFAISFGGVLLIKGWDQRFSNEYLLLGMVAAMFAGLAYNFIRKLKTSEHPLVIVLYFPLVTLPLAGSWTAAVWVLPEGPQWIYLLAVGVLTQIAQYYMTRSYQEEELSKVAPIQYMGIIFGLAFGWWLFDESFHPMGYAGIVLVLLGVGLNLIYKQRTKRTQG